MNKRNVLKLLFLDIDGIFYNYINREYIPKELVEETLSPYLEDGYRIYWITHQDLPRVKFIMRLYDLEEFTISPYSSGYWCISKIQFLLLTLRKYHPTKSFDKMILDSDFYIFDDMPHEYTFPSWRYLSDIKAIRKIYNRLNTYLHSDFAMNKTKDMFHARKVYRKLWDLFFKIKKGVIL